MTEIKTFSMPTDRKFEVGGEVYEWVTPYWEDLAAIFDEDVADTLRALADAEKDPAERLEDSEPAQQTRENIEKMQKRIMLFLDEKDHERFQALTRRKKDPVAMFMWQQVYTWLLEVATGRPTEQPSPSEAGAGNGAPSSQAGSRSRAAGRRR